MLTLVPAIITKQHFNQTRTVNELTRHPFFTEVQAPTRTNVSPRVFGPARFVLRFQGKRCKASSATVHTFETRSILCVLSPSRFSKLIMDFRIFQTSGRASAKGPRPKPRNKMFGVRFAAAFLQIAFVGAFEEFNGVTAYQDELGWAPQWQPRTKG